MSYDRTSKQTESTTLYIVILVWEPNAAKVTKSYSRRLPALKRFYRGTKFFTIKVDPVNLESQNQAKNIPMGLLSSSIKI